MTNLLLKTRPLTGLKSGATPAFVEYLQKHVQPKIDEERMKLSIFDVDSLQIGSWRVRHTILSTISYIQLLIN